MENHAPAPIPELEKAVQSEIAAIPGALLENVMRNFSDRLQESIKIEGLHLSWIIFHIYLLSRLPIRLSIFNHKLFKI